MELPVGESYSQQFPVTRDDTASHVGSGTVPVLATPSMILFMERVASSWVSKFLPDDLISVGTKVCVEHLSAVTPGVTVRCTIKLIEQSKRRLKFEVEVTDDEGETVGRGTHVRYIVDKEGFMSKLKSS